MLQPLCAGSPRIGIWGWIPLRFGMFWVRLLRVACGRLTSKSQQVGTPNLSQAHETLGSEEVGTVCHLIGRCCMW